jgi:hypothetical protein
MDIITRNYCMYDECKNRPNDWIFLCVFVLYSIVDQRCVNVFTKRNFVFGKKNIHDFRIGN